jgi:hypothetical protein
MAGPRRRRGPSLRLVSRLVRQGEHDLILLLAPCSPVFARASSSCQKESICWPMWRAALCVVVCVLWWCVMCERTKKGPGKGKKREREVESQDTWSRHASPATPGWCQANIHVAPTDTPRPFTTWTGKHTSCRCRTILLRTYIPLHCM